MSIQFGVWDFAGRPIDHKLFANSRAVIESFTSFPLRIHQENALLIIDATGNSALCTESNSGPEARHSDRFLWAGRLDNRTELQGLADCWFASVNDAELVHRGFDRMGSAIFPWIIGDWAISIVRKSSSELILARDFVGTRPLFYRIQGSLVTWSTILEPLVMLTEKLPALCEEFVAAWLSSFPQSHSTPYREIFSVPPSSFVRISPNEVVTRKYWTLESLQTIRYRTDQQYQEHFLSSFRVAVSRRLAPPWPILAELSGGMDSSSIVCVSDALLFETPGGRLDTITYFDSAEPAWDELPYARAVEAKRGKIGHHIDMNPPPHVPSRPGNQRLSAVPQSPYSRTPAAIDFDRIVAESGYRAILSGVGGDEILGGIPTPIPELADLLTSFKAIPFLRQSLRWSITKKKSVFRLWQNVLRAFLPDQSSDSPGLLENSAWLTAEFRARNREQLRFPKAQFRCWGPLPSLQANAAAIDLLSRQISWNSVSGPSGLEWRYPFLDRELVAFCASIPREQLLRPTQRRSLMRRALAEMVPQEILQRKRKAYVSRGLVGMLLAQWQQLRTTPFCLEELGIVNSDSLGEVVQQANQGKQVPILALLRTLALEQWMRDLTTNGHLQDAAVLGNGKKAPLPPVSQELLG